MAHENTWWCFILEVFLGKDIKNESKPAFE